MQCFSSRKALFNGEGIFTSKAQCIEKGNFFGQKLLDWGFSKEKEKELVDGEFEGFLVSCTQPFRTPNLYRNCQNPYKVEGFALMANDLRTLCSVGCLKKERK